VHRDVGRGCADADRVGRAGLQNGEGLTRDPRSLPAMTAVCWCVLLLRLHRTLSHLTPVIRLGQYAFPHVRQSLKKVFPELISVGVPL